MQKNLTTIGSCIKETLQAIARLLTLSFCSNWMLQRHCTDPIWNQRTSFCFQRLKTPKMNSTCEAGGVIGGLFLLDESAVDTYA
ncbi:hypothetical protein TNCT_427891 [Trichonephila clavata]|uniref:Uncharacterized protein n=1 Tax=Trichonephila clavata TaxID=2740835 RepID=A0A8X6HI10_TRICU|nr:hypothetical protein TNCT_427891 [Trichonephila clavata]